jgi:hypothetical protein
MKLIFYATPHFDINMSVMMKVSIIFTIPNNPPSDEDLFGSASVGVTTGSVVATTWLTCVIFMLQPPHTWLGHVWCSLLFLTV